MKQKIKLDTLTVELFILFLFDLLLLNLPLTNILGYEYSAANSIMITLLSGIYTISVFITGPSQKEGLRVFLRKVFTPYLLFLILPLLLSVCAAFFVRNCSLFQGFLFYLVLTVPAVVIGSAVAISSCYLSPKFPRTLFILIYVIILLIPLLYIYLYPQIYFYNPVIGYYPGTIYDEGLSVGIRLTLYRLLNIIYFGSLGLSAFVLINRKGKREVIKRIVFSVSFILIAIIFILSGDSLGFTTTLSKMKAELSGHLNTEHFELVFDPRIQKKFIENIALHNEYYYEQVTNALRVSKTERITTFLFLNSDQKKELLGSANADVAKPWLNQLYISYENYEQTLKHEITHCISGQFGTTPFKVSYHFNPSLLEGIAVALEDDNDGHTAHYMAALAFHNNFRFPVQSLFSGFNFFGQISCLSYVYAGSFVKFLIEKYGIEKFKRIYKGAEYKDVYGKSIDELSDQYAAFIETVDAGNQADAANYYFGRKPIFRKICARYLAEKVDEGWQLYNSGSYTSSRDLFREILDKSDSYQALLGYVNSLRKLNENAAALSVIEKYINNFHGTSYFYNLELLRADLLVVNRKIRQAENLYAALIRQNASREYYNLASIRSKMSADSLRMENYLRGSDFDKYNILMELNSDSVNYASVPVMIGLSEKFSENYDSFMKNWKDRFRVYDFTSGYAAYRMAQYSVRNLEFQDARKFIIMALDFKNNIEFSEVLTAELKKINWFINFGAEILPDLNRGQMNN